MHVLTSNLSVVRQTKIEMWCNRYWEVDPDADSEACRHHKPYRIEVIGVTCDPGLAVARGVWRKLRTGRSVRSATLLRSHRLFSEHYERTAHLVDVATLYHTGAASTHRAARSHALPANPLVHMLYICLILPGC